MGAAGNQSLDFDISVLACLVPHPTMKCQGMTVPVLLQLLSELLCHVLIYNGKLLVSAFNAQGLLCLLCSVITY